MLGERLETLPPCLRSDFCKHRAEPSFSFEASHPEKASLSLTAKSWFVESQSY